MQSNEGDGTSADSIAAQRSLNHDAVFHDTTKATRRLKL